MITAIKKRIKRRTSEKRVPRRFSSVTGPVKKAFRKGSSMTVSMSVASAHADRDDIDAIAAGAASDRQAIFHETILPLIQESDKNKRKPVVPSFLLDEIELGPKLGSGEFSNVFEVRSFRLDAEFNEGMLDETSQSREMMKRCEIFHNTGRARYALKHLKDEYFADHTQDEYIQAATDLSCEAELLSHLQHPHIIKLRGVAHNGAAAFADGPSGYFLVIDRLFETLDVRIKAWRDEADRKPRTGLIPHDDMDPMDTDEMDIILDDRLFVGLQIAAALRYLHSHSIMFRDLKPCNIGFDVRGDVKIFDFGLACVVPDDNPHDDLYVMSGAGSPRYMAPEVLMLQRYNLKADVYSFSILLWAMLAAATPYSFVKGRAELERFVVNEKGRPPINISWPAVIRETIKDGFDAEIEKRPRIEDIYDKIHHQLEIIRGGMRFSLRDSNINRRRSSASYKRLLQMFEE
mmetsp:Transcript_3714/g.8246  ORF Transcript_3714/g.8246 Transcript_3714/m.8246 type:complete len:461 (+) Transcript_3714:198-1580(+)